MQLFQWGACNVSSTILTKRFNIGFHTYDKINRPVQTIRILRIIIDSFCASFVDTGCLSFSLSLSLSLEKKANNRNNVKARRQIPRNKSRSSISATHPRENWLERYSTNSLISGTRTQCTHNYKQRERIHLIGRRDNESGGGGGEWFESGVTNHLDRWQRYACIYVSQTHVDCTLTEYLHTYVRTHIICNTHREIYTYIYIHI